MKQVHIEEIPILGQRLFILLNSIVPNANTQIFYRIGLKNGDNRKISNVVITYGTHLVKFHINNIINIYMSVINNDYQTNLLFKQFTGVAATQLDQQFSNEPYRAIKNIFSRDIFIEEVPLEAPISIYNLDNSGAWVDSIGALPSVNSSNTFAQVYPDSKLQFYKNVELTAVPGSNSRVWYKLDTSNNNILQDTINFKFDDINSTYLMRIKYNNGAVYVNNPINSYPSILGS